MKRMICLFGFLAVFCLAIPAFSQPPPQSKTIALTDGSVIKGMVVGFKDGFYYIKTEKLGQVSIHDSNVQSITATAPGSGLSHASQHNVSHSPGQSSGAQQGRSNQTGEGLPQSKEQINQMIQGLLNDPEITNELSVLIQDPEIANMLNDPNFYTAIFSFDPDQISSNPNVQKFADHPKLQTLFKKIAQKLNLTVSP